ncbi:MAG: glycosyltransferase [bacterium]|nr:glycosyltransferase [bacterium]
MQNEQRPIVVFISSYPPRECGIATFTADLVRAIGATTPLFVPKILALNDTATSFYHYPEEVFLQITDTDERAFINTAEILNRLDRVSAVNIQHEFGLFGGRQGSHLIGFITRLTKPIITTFHTVLPNPDDRMRLVVQLLLKKSKQCIVMTKNAREILRTVYGATKAVTVVPHGIPDVAFEKSDAAKQALGLGHHLVLSTFGLLSAGKGIEYVLDALPEVVRRFPHVAYLIIGETHPVVRRKEGERYRKMLMRRVLQLRLEEHVKFYDRYLPLEEILQFLRATDIYVASSLDPYQAVSGTLSYALGAGRPVIATSFAYAKEMVTPGVGMQVPLRDARAMSDALLALVGDDDRREKMASRAYTTTRAMLWPKVAATYARILHSYIVTPKHVTSPALPPLRMTHLERLTDERGMMQFSRGAVPDRASGYTVDDNARALLFAAQYYHVTGDKTILSLLRRYCTFLFNGERSDGSFTNYIDEHGRATPQNYGEDIADATGRAITGLAAVAVTLRLPSDLRHRAELSAKRALAIITRSSSLRTTAFALLGVSELSRLHNGVEYIPIVRRFADAIVTRYEQEASFDWQWFEPMLTYANAVIPHALIAAYRVAHNDRYRNIAKKTVDFLIEKTLQDTVYMPIGNKGWCTRDGRCAHFDQQPEDPSAMVMALFALYEITQEEQYRMYALRTFSWFLGENILRQPLYDSVSGGCHDGLSPTAVNSNEGAESTISYLLARLAIERYGT